MDRPTSRSKSASGRESSFGRNTSGHKGWMPVVFKNGTHGKTQEGFKNVLNNEEFIPKEGFNGEPPYPTGEVVPCHASAAYREGWERIFGKKEPDHARSQ